MAGVNQRKWKSFPLGTKSGLRRLFSAAIACQGGVGQPFVQRMTAAGLPRNNSLVKASLVDGDVHGYFVILLGLRSARNSFDCITIQPALFVNEKGSIGETSARAEAQGKLLLTGLPSISMLVDLTSKRGVLVRLGKAFQCAHAPRRSCPMPSPVISPSTTLLNPWRVGCGPTSAMVWRCSGMKGPQAATFAAQ